MWMYTKTIDGNLFQHDFSFTENLQHDIAKI